MRLKINPLKFFWATLFILCNTSQVLSQGIPTKSELLAHYGFTQTEINNSDEKIVFYSYQQGEQKPSKLILYIQGSDPSPLFSYKKTDEGIQKLCFLKGEFKELSNEYLYTAIEKVGFEGVIDEDNIPKPTIYQEKNSLPYRVFQANAVINYLDSINQFSKIIIYGHSEGAPVAAKLATQNAKITHLGFWAGNALPDFYDFVLETRKEYYKGNISAEKAQKQIDETIDSFVNHIARDTANTNMAGYTNLLWWSYAEPPLNNLLKLTIPVYVQVATEDENAPIESSYLIPLEFARLQKTNLSYNVCVGCDHEFNIQGKKVKRKWQELFEEFLKWTEESPSN